MLRTILKLKVASALSCLLVALLAWPMTTVVAQGQTNSFSGRATVVQVTVPPLGQTIVLADTKPLPPTGGAQDATLLTASVPVPGVLELDAEVLHAATVANGNHSRSEASVANLALTTATGTTITADFLMSKAEAQCGPGGPSVSGSSEIVGLAINGQSIIVSGQPNQTVPLPLGTGEVIINEQNSSVSGNTGDITVNALHVVVTGVADVVISSAHADITCTPPSPPPPPCPGTDFVTGGGWITGTPSGSKGNLAVAGGIKDGAFWGHLSYIDHGPNGPKVKGTGVTAYTVILDANGKPTTKRHIEGTCEINGQSGYTYQVDVDDQGEPGRNDTFSLRLLNAGYSASGNLTGGNIQLHTPCQ